jgi:hypothetical protein
MRAIRIVTSVTGCVGPARSRSGDVSTDREDPDAIQVVTSDDL